MSRRVAAAKTANEDVRTLEVRTQNEGLFRIEIPRSYKVTFSKINPHSSGGYSGELALRIYEGEDKQRACFTGVISFRDTSLRFERRVKRRREDAKAEHGPDGSRVERESRTEYEWVGDPGDDDGAPF